jgi:hypothetical protein
MEYVIKLTDKEVAGYLREYFRRSLRGQRSSPIWKVLKESGRLKLLPRGDPTKGRQVAAERHRQNSSASSQPKTSVT